MNTGFDTLTEESSEEPYSRAFTVTPTFPRTALALSSVDSAPPTPTAPNQCNLSKECLAVQVRTTPGQEDDGERDESFSSLDLFEVFVRLDGIRPKNQLNNKLAFKCIKSHQKCCFRDPSTIVVENPYLMFAFALLAIHCMASLSLSHLRFHSFRPTGVATDIELPTLRP